MWFWYNLDLTFNIRYNSVLAEVSNAYKQNPEIINELLPKFQNAQFDQMDNLFDNLKIRTAFGM